ncbi:transglycosylase SLT domain-containing protein [Pantoea sp. Mb-10]|uniref:transglycosylase SLT domain-containing protein n=1 Tax=unclassified Pantoea TaxID=2630326 RepID=UPI001E58CE8C|nr:MULTISPECIES: transglycosylase SLT domain-containing protein [unclassified Pantoea]MCE0489044.1 transglycosylase SLT domain-containing protein [Pantoea sp. Mb-10]MCE0503600.1 transglycosylase SLT domain-containing protein [Pantoea sp. Pb-8]
MTRRRALLLILGLLPFIHDAKATCWTLAEYTYGIEAELLSAIAIAESSMRPTAKNINGNGTYDIGLMQINSIHLPALRNKGISEAMLIDNPCISVLVGASILKKMVFRFGFGWEAVGAYNAGTSPARRARRYEYAQKIAAIYVQRNARSPW